MYRVSEGAEQDSVSGAGILINDGPPNCIFAKINFYKGVPVYAVIQALRNIHNGEFLHLYYGPDHNMRGGKYSIGTQSYQELVRFCEDGFYRVGRITDKNLGSHENNLFLYIMGTSSVFFSLHLRGVLKVSKTKKLMKEETIAQAMRLMPPTFFSAYDVILDLVTDLLALNETDDKLISTIDQLSQDLSESALLQTLVGMKMAASLSSSSIPTYKAFGEVIDHLSLVVNGTLYGTYVGKEEGPNHVKMPDIPLDSDFIFKRYSILPSTLKTAIYQRIQEHIEFLGDNRFPDKKKKIEALLVNLGGFAHK